MIYLSILFSGKWEKLLLLPCSLALAHDPCLGVTSKNNAINNVEQ